ncbi:MAG TPA: hypothetical protein VI861_01085 [Rickettsiales bacterium]|nr:hypothetical protein [Rickettsiales bacterium]
MSNEIETKNFLNQIKNEARAEGILQFFEKHKKLLKRIAIYFTVFLFTYFIFSVINSSLQEKYSEIFHQAMIDEELGNAAKAQENLETIYKANFAPYGVKGLAGLRLAAIHLQKNDKEIALTIYKNIATNFLYNDFVQESAALTATKIIVIGFDQNSAEKNREKTKKEIEKLASGNSILRDAFYEQQAIFLIKIEQKEKARSFLEKIVKSEKATQSQKTRASNLIKLI